MPRRPGLRANRGSAPPKNSGYVGGYPQGCACSNCGSLTRAMEQVGAQHARGICCLGLCVLVFRASCKYIEKEARDVSDSHSDR